MSKINLEKILKLDELKKVFKHFSVVTKLDVALYDKDGKAIIKFYSDKDNICRLAHANAEYSTKCFASVKYGGQKAAELGEPYIYSCGCGLIMCSAAVLLGGELIGSIVCGPVLLWEVDDIAVEEFYQKNSRLGLQKEDVANYLGASRQLSCINMTSAAYMLSVLVNYMCNQENEFLAQRKKISLQQAEIAEHILNQKVNAMNFEVFEKATRLSKYPSELEKELIAYVQMGDTIKFKSILNNFLGEIFSYSAGNLDMVKSRLHELVAILSRAAVDAGAPLEALTEAIKKFDTILGKEMKFEDICYTTSEVLESFIETVYLYRGAAKNSQHLNKAIKFIKEHFTDELTLNAVAKSVFVSPYYLSHLFREEMDMTFSDYVLKVRMEHAKELMKENGNVKDISLMVGFNDSNYFAKAFKRFFGISPKSYMAFYKVQK